MSYLIKLVKRSTVTLQRQETLFEDEHGHTTTSHLWLTAVVAVCLQSELKYSDPSQQQLYTVNTAQHTNH